MRKGLSSFRDLRGRLARVHAGQDARVEGDYASEVQPLVDDLNALLEHRDQVVRRARRQGRRPRARPEDAARGADPRSRARPCRRPDRILPMRSRPRSRGCSARSTTTSRRRVPRRRAPRPARPSVVRDSAEALARTLAAPPRGARRHDPGRCRSGACRPGPAGGPRRDARQPPRQRLQVGPRHGRDLVGDRRRRSWRSRWMTTAPAFRPAQRETRPAARRQGRRSRARLRPRPRHRPRSRRALPRIALAARSARRGHARQAPIARRPHLSQALLGAYPPQRSAPQVAGSTLIEQSLATRRFLLSWWRSSASVPGHWRCSACMASWHTDGQLPTSNFQLPRMRDYPSS